MIHFQSAAIITGGGDWVEISVPMPFDGALLLEGSRVRSNEIFGKERSSKSCRPKTNEAIGIVWPIAEMTGPERMGAALSHARRYALFRLVLERAAADPSNDFNSVSASAIDLSSNPTDAANAQNQWGSRQSERRPFGHFRC
jgi:hypothetical protein